MLLITGGSGFIGSHFHNYIPHNEIVNLDLNPPAFKHSARFFQGDIRVKKDLEHVIQGNRIETILSLAAKHHDFGIGHDEYFDTNQEGTQTLCDVASASGIKNIIFYSSVAVYGIRNEVSSENMDPKPDSPYGASKLAGEQVLYKWAQQDLSRKVLIIRPTVTFGPHNMANMYNLIRQIDSGLYFHVGEGKNIKSIAYVENLVQATLFLKDRMVSGVSIYNYADEPQLSSYEIGESIAQALGKKISFRIPLALIQWITWPFDLAIKITGKNIPISTARVKKLATETHHSPKKILNEGFKPEFSTKQGLQKMVDWYKKQKLG
jgi:nucleoside-diphosphate-sugar epimerase